MKILILSQWYPPEPMELLSDMAETLQAQGHDVEILTGFPNWPSGELYPGYKITIRMKEVIGGVPITRVPIYPDHGLSALKRIANFLSFTLSSSVLGPFYMDKPDIIHVIQLPTACIPAWFLSKLWNVPFTYEVQDMWPETLAATKMLKSKMLLWLVGRYCDWTYKKASAIRVISRGFKENLIQKGVPEEKIHVIHNWVNSEFYKPVDRDSEFSKKFECDDKFTIVYAGTIGLAQGLEVLLDVADRLKHFERIRFLVVGDGVDLPRLTKMAKSRSLTNIVFTGRFPGKDMNRIYSIADVLLVHLKNEPLFRITIPHKIVTYMASEKPVLAAIEGEASEIVKKSNAGMTCKPSDPNDLAKSIIEMYHLEQQRLKQLGSNGRKEILRAFDRDTLVKSLAGMFRTLVKRKSDSSLCDKSKWA